jgi:hypothetical protein
MSKRNDISRLKNYRAVQKLDKIDRFERNRLWLYNIQMNHTLQQYPEILAMVYDHPTRVLTVRYMGMSLHWSLMSGKTTIQHGNEPVRIIDIAPEQLHMRMLHQGKRGFM